MRWLSTTFIVLLMLCGCPVPDDGGTAGSTDTPRTAANSGSGSGTPATVAPPVTVWADPLLEPLLGGLAGKFGEYYPGGYQVEYVDRGELIGRFADGVPESLPGVFLFTGVDTLRLLVESGAADETTSRPFAGDRLALIQQTDAGYATPTLFDIYTLRYEAILTGSELTTTGHYATQALISDGAMPRVEDKLVTADTLGEIIEAVQGSDRKLAILPVSAIGEAAGIEVILLIGEDLHKDIQYIAAANVAEAPGQLELMMFLSEDEEIQGLIPGYGYLDLEMAFEED